MAVQNESWLQYYARITVLGVLKGIQRGRLTVVLKYRGEAPSEVLGTEPSGDDGRELDVVVVFKSPKVWLRICQAFDLVRDVHGDSTYLPYRP